MTRATAVTAVLLLGAAESRAQTPQSLVPGTRLRLSAAGLPHGRLVGTLSADDERALAVMTEDQQLVRVQRDTIGRLEVSRGRRGSAKKGFLIGAAAGFSTLALCMPDKTYHPHCSFDNTVGPLAAMTVTGGLMGAAIGQFIRSDEWVDLQTDRVHVDVRPTLAPEAGARGERPGAALGLRVSVGF